MSDKRIIMIIIAIAAFTGAGVFLYLSMANSTPSTSSGGAGLGATAQSAILPNGLKLDFDKLKKFNPSGRKFQYPAVTPADSGQPLGTIMKQ